jgi:tetrapyrrole methylase family protein / MazG family protein
VLDALLAEARLRWRLDPADGLAIVPAERLIAAPLEPARPVLIVPLAVLRATAPAEPPVPIPGRHGPAGRDALAVLRRLYPPDHPVGRFGTPEGTTVGALAAEDLSGPLYLGPVAPELAAASPWGMPWISNRLRAPDGCPWDREQTHESLRNHLLEEAYEVYDALADGATPELAAELGDLWLQVVLHAQLAAEAGVFDLADVQAAIASKIVRRHPHVFGDAEVRTATDVNRQWERIKQAERAAEAAAAASDGRPATPPKSALDGVSRSMPALAASQEMQERAAHLGYDWPSVEGILEKVAEELGELAEAEGPAARAEELGDLLMVVVNLARHHDVDAEAALRTANQKFRRRFGIVERLAAERGVALRDLSFAQLDELWDAAKAELAASAGPPPAGMRPDGPAPAGPPPAGMRPDGAAPAGPPPAGMRPDGPAPAGPPPAGMRPDGPAPAGPPPAGMRPDGPAPAGPPPAGMRPDGPAPAGPPPAGAPSEDAPATGAPPDGPAARGPARDNGPEEVPR